mgnify:CR=1 FL=1
MRKAMQTVCSLIVALSLAVSAGAAGFTPSVEQKGAPVPNQKNVTVTALVDLDKAPEKVQKVVEEAHKVIVEAKSVVKAVPALEAFLKEMKADNKADNKTDNKTNNKTDNKTDKKTDSKTDDQADGNKDDQKTDVMADVKAEDLVVRDLFYVELDKDLKPGQEKVVVFNTEGIQKGDFLVVMVFVDGEWVILDTDKVKITADGKVQVTFDAVGPVAFVTAK